MKPEVVVDEVCELGEGPLWNPVERRLYWVDYMRGRIYCFDPATGTHEKLYDGDRVASFTFQSDGTLLLFMDGPSVVLWRDGELRHVIEGIQGEEDNHFNDTISDYTGRVFCGTVPNDLDRATEGLGSLYRLDIDGSITRILDGIQCSNGLGFSPDHKQMYYTDSTARKIYVFDYDEQFGEISNQQVFVDTAEEEGLPDGMTVDSEGCLWSARWDASAVVRYNPEGVEILRYRFSAMKVSSVTFGGDDYRDIYLTSAGGNDRSVEGDDAGALFRLRTEVKGVPEYYSHIGL